jgi:hypothetical protein
MQLFVLHTKSCVWLLTGNNGTKVQVEVGPVIGFCDGMAVTKKLHARLQTYTPARSLNSAMNRRGTGIHLLSDNEKGAEQPRVPGLITRILITKIPGA